MSKSELNVHYLAIVTSKATHNLNFKTKEAVDKANADVSAARRDTNHPLVEITDDYDAHVMIDSATISSHQVGSVRGDHECEHDRGTLKMYADLDWAEKLGKDEKLLEAQKKQSARQRLAIPRPGN